MKVTNRLGLPQAIVNAVSNDTYTRGAANISVTGLSDPPRKVALAEVYGDALVEDASDLIYALLGKAIHTILEENAPTDGSVSVEQRKFMTVPGPLGDWIVSGASDNLDLLRLPDGKVGIDDWKTAKVDEMVYGVKVERIQQLNTYRVLHVAHGVDVGALRDIFILRDWSKVQAARSAATPTIGGGSADGYPTSQVVIHDIEMWPLEVAAGWISERVALHQRTQADFNLAISGAVTPEQAGEAQAALPECSDDERWARPTRYAAVKVGADRASRTFLARADADKYATEHTEGFVYSVEQVGTKFKIVKDGSVRASKTCDTREEADAWIAEKQAPAYNVVVRPGESIRCAYYCNVAAVCAQWQRLKQTEGVVEDGE